MKKLVALSGYCWVFTALALAVLCGISMYAIKQPDSQSAIWILGTIFTLLLIIVIWYMPMAITLDEDSLRVERPLRIKTIPLSEIENIKMCPPSMGEKTICGSYGFMGHYGWFSEKDLGKYWLIRKCPWWLNQKSAFTVYEKFVTLRHEQATDRYLPQSRADVSAERAAGLL